MISLPAPRGALYRLRKRSVHRAALVSCLFFSGGLGGVLALCPEAPPPTRTVPDDAHRMCLLPSDSTIQPDGFSSSSSSAFFPIIDAHTHAWERCYRFNDTDQDLFGCPQSPGEMTRYIPAGVLPFPKLEEKWRSSNVSYGVLVQPSFLRVDNSYLVRQLRKHPWLRGVIVVTNADGTLDSEAVSPPLLEDMHRVGVRGVRLNLLKKSEEDMTRLNAAMNAETGDDGFVNLWAFIKEHDWHIEAQQESDGWVDLIETLVGTGCRIVVDHFSRPDPALNLEDPGWRAVLRAARDNDNIYMKVTGTYRLGVCPEILAGMAQIARESFGIERLLWGSDYPHTGCAGPDIRHCEDSQDYAALLQTVRDWYPDEEDQKRVLYSNAARVFSFPSLKC